MIIQSVRIAILLLIRSEDSCFFIGQLVCCDHKGDKSKKATAYTVKINSMMLAVSSNVLLEDIAKTFIYLYGIISLDLISKIVLAFLFVKRDNFLGEFKFWSLLFVKSSLIFIIYLIIT